LLWDCDLKWSRLGSAAVVTDVEWSGIHPQSVVPLHVIRVLEDSSRCNPSLRQKSPITSLLPVPWLISASNSPTILRHVSAFSSLTRAGTCCRSFLAVSPLSFGGPLPMDVSVMYRFLLNPFGFVGVQMGRLGSVRRDWPLKEHNLAHSTRKYHPRHDSDYLGTQWCIRGEDRF